MEKARCEGACLLNEADTCRKYVLPKLIEAGGDDDLHPSPSKRPSPTGGGEHTEALAGRDHC